VDDTRSKGVESRGNSRRDQKKFPEEGESAIAEQASMSQEKRNEFIQREELT